jgi:uncharacterized protein (DUF433 family)
MSDQKLIKRIALNPGILAGKPVIKGTWIPVEFIINLLAHGSTEGDILREYKSLTHEDIQACLLFASKSLEDSSFMPLLAKSA